MLSFFWSDHDKQINTLGAYLAVYVEPRLAEVTHTYKWELFFRDMDKGGREAAAQLSSDTNPKDLEPSTNLAEEIPEDRRVISEYRLLFFWTPVALMSAYLLYLIYSLMDEPVSEFLDTAKFGIRLVAFVLSGLVLWLSVQRSKQRERRREFIRSRLESTGATPPHKLTQGI